MANILNLVVLFLVCGVAMAEVDSVRSGNFSAGLKAAAAGNGICRSVIEPQGYGCTEHKVITTDGYILSIQRIAGKSGGNFSPVLIQHGLFMITVMMSGSPIAVEANTAAAIYDVLTLFAISQAYWDWSWDELVASDLPAMVDYINNQTKQTLHFVGHSQGNLIGLAAISKGHFLAEKLRSVSVLCPIAYMHHMSSLLMRGSIDLFAAEGLYWLKIKEFDPNG
ncbi:Triacylglycerol lipase 2 [Linum grandiflorum]